MTHAKGLHPGTVWHKSDFQCHTPRDRGWTGSPNLPGGADHHEQAREQWAEDFIRATEQAKLTAVAITDHHDICMSAYVQQAATRLNSSVKVFAGVEITCSDNAQCLVFFDPSCQAGSQKLALGIAGNILASGDDSATTCVIVHARETVSKFVDGIAAEAHLKDLAVVLPHFSADDAYKSLNEDGHHPRFASLPCDGVYIERPYSSLDPITVQKIEGKIPEWGTRSRAVLATGDNRFADWSRLGAHDCWIKLGEHSVEAIRQAMLAPEARVAFAKPDTPAERVVEIRIKSALTGPDPVTLTFNDGFNALIGGRGAGKSALLEYLRFGLGRTDRDIEGAQAPRERQVKLIDETLHGGFVEVVLEREGVRETWRRTVPDQQQISVTSHDGTIIQMTARNARERFRARAFNQKGLSSTMNDPGTAAEQITGIAAAEELDRQREIDQSIQNTKREVTTALQNLAAYWQAQVERKQAADRVSDLRQRVEALSERLAEQGIAPADLETIDSAPRFGRATTYLDEVKAEAAAGVTRLEELSRSLLLSDVSQHEGIGAFDEIAGLHNAVSAARTSVNGSLEQAVAALNGLGAAEVTARQTFATRKAAFDASYATALAAQATHRNLIDDSTRLTTELQAAEQSLSRATVGEAAKAPAVEGYTSAIKKLDRLLQDRQAILKTAADKVAGKSSQLLKARVKRDRQPVEYITALVNIFEGSHTQQVEEGCSDWVKSLLAAKPDTGWDDLRKAIVEVYEEKIRSGSPPEPSDSAATKLENLLFGGSRQITQNQRKRIYANINDAIVGTIVSAVPRDIINLSYVDQGNDIDFKQASEGQQASALLELLLRQSAGTLIIDQPEDDLDNRSIMRVVSLIRTSKSHRQLIFTTHNPNIVVNGDADKIVALRSPEPSSNPNATAPRVEIDHDGAIETPELRRAVTTIMEGGRDAFDLRGRKYRFDLAS